MIPQEAIDELLSRADLVDVIKPYVNLKAVCALFITKSPLPLQSAKPSSSFIALAVVPMAMPLVS